MVDFTDKYEAERGGSAGIYIAAAFVVAVLLFALFAGGGGTSTDPALLAVPEATEGATTPAVGE